MEAPFQLPLRRSVHLSQKCFLPQSSRNASKLQAFSGLPSLPLPIWSMAIQLSHTLNSHLKWSSTWMGPFWKKAVLQKSVLQIYSISDPCPPLAGHNCVSPEEQCAWPAVLSHLPIHLCTLTCMVNLLCWTPSLFYWGISSCKHMQLRCLWQPHRALWPLLKIMQWTGQPSQMSGSKGQDFNWGLMQLKPLPLVRENADCITQQEEGRMVPYSH